MGGRLVLVSDPDAVGKYPDEGESVYFGSQVKGTVLMVRKSGLWKLEEDDHIKSTVRNRDQWIYASAQLAVSVLCSPGSLAANNPSHSKDGYSHTN